MDVLKRVPVREQDPKVRATNFEEVCLGYNQEEAQAEAQGQDNRCHAPEVAHKITPKYDVIAVFIHILQEMCIGVASNSGANVNKL